MNRRSFIRMSGCALAAGLLARRAAGADAETKPYAPALLVDSQGRPLRARALEPGPTYLFFYPYRGTPAFLIDLDRAAGPRQFEDNGFQRNWAGGVGPKRSIVAFSAICQHELSRPTPSRSPITYSAIATPTAQGPGLITCCAHNAVYDPSAGARVVSGPAESALTSVVLSYDGADDSLRAVGTSGIEVYDDFFREFKAELMHEFGPGQAREEQKGAARVMLLKDYSAELLTC